MAAKRLMQEGKDDCKKRKDKCRKEKGNRKKIDTKKAAVEKRIAT